MKTEKKRWILSITPQIWNITEKRKMYAATTKTEVLRVKNRDFVIFYILGTGKFNGTYEIKSKWREPSKKWPIRVTDEVDLSVIKIGTVNARNLAPSLEFVKKSKWIGLHLHSGLANYGNPITAKDYKTISKNMKHNPKLFT